MKASIILALVLCSFSALADSLPIITLSPTNLTVSPGGTATFTVTATSATSYQWQFNGVDISGATGATLQVANAQSTNCGYYMVVAKNVTGWVPSQLAYLSLDYTFGIFPSTAGGVLPLSNTNNTYFQGDIEPYAGGMTPTNGAAQIVAGPELDQMRAVGQIVPYRVSPVSNRFYNGYYNAPDQSVSTIKPGQTFYYSVVVNYTNNGFSSRQPSTIMKLTAGTNGLPAPSTYGLKFPAWFAGEGVEPYFYGGSPTNLLLVSGETFIVTNNYFAYTDYGVPTVQWRKNGKAIAGGTNNVFDLSPYHGVDGDGHSTLTLTNVQASDAGIYDLIVYGSEWVVSSKVFLSVQTTNGQGVFQKPKFSGTNFTCDLVGAAGRNYKVQCSTNLASWNDLTTLSNVTGTVTFTNATSSTGAQFYRTVLVP